MRIEEKCTKFCWSRSVANSFFNVEYMPYHSKQYIDIGCRLPSQEFNFGLVGTALKEDKIIIIMKGKNS